MNPCEIEFWLYGKEPADQTTSSAESTPVLGKTTWLGIVPGGGGTQRLARLVGEGMAMQMILSGDMITAQQAKEIGLVNEVVPADQLEARAMELANKIAEASFD